LQQRALVFSHLALATGFGAFSKKIEVEEFGNKEPQPLEILSRQQSSMPFRSRLRFRGVVTKNLSL